MMLLFGLVLGLSVGLARARWHDQAYQAPMPRAVWLAFVAILPQLAIAYLPGTRSLFPDWLAATGLSLSLILFAGFAWLNRGLPGMPILITGLLLNLIVIAANGGWMPISPQTASHLNHADGLQLSQLGSRFGGKGILLAPQSTHLEFLADRFLLPAWSPYQAAFSLGDVLIGIGAFWLFARPAFKIENPRKERELNHDYIY
jgi:hypothetical protein